MIKLWSSDGVHAAPPDDQSLHLVSSRTRVIEVAVHKSAWLVYVSKIGYLSWHIFLFKLMITSLFFSIDQQQKSLKDPNSEMMSEAIFSKHDEEKKVYVSFLKSDQKK